MIVINYAKCRPDLPKGTTLYPKRAGRTRPQYSWISAEQL